MSLLTLPYALANGAGNWPDADKFMADYHFLQALLAANGVKNGGFERWNAGTSFSSPANGAALADNWLLASGGTSAPTFTIAREATTIDVGVYSAKVNITVAGSSNSFLDLQQAIANYLAYRGETVLAGCRIYVATGTKVRVRVYDGVTSAYSSYHTGSGSWENLQASLVVSNASTQLLVSLEITSDFTGAVYLDGAYVYAIPATMSAAAKTALRYSPLSDINFVSLLGDTMQGALAMGGFGLTGLPAATAAGQALRYEQLFPGVNGTFFGVGRNRIINGEMRIDQANAGAATAGIVASGVYGPDMYRGQGMAAAGVFTLQRITTTPPTGATHSMRATCTTADASIAAGDNYVVRHFIEGNNVRDFLLGTANAVQVTLSFWVRSSLTGTYCVAFKNSAVDRNYIVEYTISAANTWEKKTVTLTCDTTGTWLTDAGIGLELTWTLAAGSTFQGTANTWQAGNLHATANQVNFMSSNTTRTWDLALVQLEVGAVATSFEYRPFGLELALCQRYYEISTGFDLLPSADGGTQLAVATQVGATTMNSQIFAFRATKRVSPTITTWEITAHASGQATWKGTGGANTNRTTTTNTVNANGFSLTQGAATDQALFAAWTADARY